MKHPPLFLAAGMAISGVAAAQSSVTLYGSLDQSPLYVSNVGGSHTYRVTGGTTQPDRFGFRGSEDLGSGLSALFQLEGGISPDTGTQINPTKFWNRETKVGLSSTTLGTLVLGHLPDVMFDYAGKYSNGYNLFNFNLFHPGNFDGLANQNAFDNAAKYISPTFAGLQGTLEYSTGEGAGRGTSAGLNYTNGGLRAGLAYSRRDLSALDIAGRTGIRTALGRSFTPGVMVTMNRVSAIGLGAAYTIGEWSVNGLFTQNDIELGAARTKPRNFDIGATWRMTPANWVNAGYSRSTFDSVRWNTLALMDMYWLSRRTQVYAQVTTQRASGANGFGSLNGVGVSSTNKQTVVGVGVHHSF